MAFFVGIAITFGLSALTAWLVGAAVRAGLSSRTIAAEQPAGPAARPALAAGLPVRTLTSGDFPATHDQGSFGEALTILAMAREGWRPVNGKRGGGPQGIDGIFLRDGPSGWEAVLIETKTGSSPYADRQMDDAKLMGDLDALYVETASEAEQAVYQALHDALQSGAPHVRKELWRHDLSTGSTQVTLLGRSGERLPRGRRLALGAQVEALAAIVSEVDRQRAYLKG
ncbi:MAG: hypothetical protein ABL308_06155 [Oceanicaulis sp.]